jgi:AraC-like DNA-binding protein
MGSPYREYTPGLDWAHWIECSWNVTTSQPLQGYPVRPDGCLDIIYSHERGLIAVGAMTAEQRYDLSAGTRMVGVRFRPGMAGRFLRAAPAELTDLAVPLEDLWGRSARDLKVRLDETRSAVECIRAITGQLRFPSGQPGSVQRAVQALAAARGQVDLDEIARQANLSPRQFRRRCLEESGLTPKHLCRVLRFRYACELARAGGRPEWPSIALEAGYFDQAHFIRDFREFTGKTPMSVFSNTDAGLPG